MSNLPNKLMRMSNIPKQMWISSCGVQESCHSNQLASTNSFPTFLLAEDQVHTLQYYQTITYRCLGTHKLNAKLYAWLFKEMTRVLKVGGTASLLTLERALIESLLNSFKNFEVMNFYTVC